MIEGFCFLTFRDRPRTCFVTQSKKREERLAGAKNISMFGSEHGHSHRPVSFALRHFYKARKKLLRARQLFFTNFQQSHAGQEAGQSGHSNSTGPLDAAAKIRTT
jgi:hypothetical protein